MEERLQLLDLLIPQSQIKQLAERAEAACNVSGSRVADVHIIENSIRSALIEMMLRARELMQ